VSIDSGKSTRDEAGNKIKKAFDELDILRKRNAELERLAITQNKTSLEGTETECEKEWKDIKVFNFSLIQDCTLQIMERLGLAPKKSVPEPNPLANPKDQQTKIPSSSKIDKEDTILLLPNGKDLDIKADSEFGKDLISIMQGFSF
jgi:hypothetical protein